MKRVTCILTVLMLVVIGCQRSGAESVVREFMEGLKEGQSARVVNNVCGDFLMPTLPKGMISAYSLKIAQEDTSAAVVEVQAEIAAQVFGITVHKNVDFIARAEMQRGRWCVTKDSLENLVKALSTFK